MRLVGYPGGVNSGWTHNDESLISMHMKAMYWQCVDVFAHTGMLLNGLPQSVTQIC